MVIYKAQDIHICCCMDIFVGIAQIIASLATAIALVFVARSNKYARDAVVRAQEMFDLESLRDVRKQASMVTCWPAKPRNADAGKQSWGVMVSNSSAEPIFNLRLFRVTGKSNRGKHIQGLDSMIATVPPGIFFVAEAEPGRSEKADAQDYDPITGNIAYMASLEFADCSGALWSRSSQGVLSMQEQHEL